jgi:hypothetical protein
LPSASSTDGRVAPPWERDGPVVQRYLDTAKSVLMESAAFFRRMRREGGLGAPLVYAIVGIVIGSLGSLLSTTMMPFGGFGDHGGLFAAVIMVPLLSLVGLFIGSGILHVLFMFVAGSRQTFETTFRLVAYTSGSTSPFNIIPFVGGLVSGIWALLVLILGGAEAHEVPQGKAAIAVLLPAVLCCGAAMIFGGALLALIFGAAAAGMRP